MDIVIYCAEAFLVAYLMRILAYRLGIPSVSAYVIGGVALGGSLFLWIPGIDTFAKEWIFSESVLDSMLFITEISLGAIALAIGAELEWSKIKQLGKSIFSIAVCEAFGAFFVVVIVTFIIWRNFPLAFILGAVSSATAPAATVAVIQQYKARGPLTNTVLAVVGIDDAISFIIFAFALAVAKGNLKGEHVDLMSGAVMPLIAIIIAIAIGSVIGLVGARLMIAAKDHDTAVFLLGAIVMWVTALSAKAEVSELLANMAAGVVIVNAYPRLKNRIRAIFNAFMPLFYAMFFIIGGAHLDLRVFPTVWALALIYFLARSVGKIAGSYGGAVISGALPQVKKYAGFSLLPQVGAAIALALVVQQQVGLGEYGEAGKILSEKTINVLLISTLLTEFIGPYLTKIALFKSGEAAR